MSTEQLDKILNTELHKEPVDGDAVRLIMNVLWEREKDMPVEITPEIQRAWDKYQHDIAQIREETRRECRRRSWLIRSAVAAVTLVVLLVPIIPQEAGAENLWKALVRLSSEVVEFFSPSDNGSRVLEYTFKTDNAGLQQVYDTAVEYGVNIPVVPMKLPDGSELAEFAIESYPASTRIYSRFMCDGKPIVFYIDIYRAEVSHKYQKDGTEVETYECGGIVHYILQNNDTKAAIWVRDNIECSIFIDCQDEILYKILDSIYGMRGT